MATVAGIDKSRISNINQCIDDWVANGKLAGASISVIRQNRLVHESYHGYQDLYKQIPLTKDSNTIFRIYSMTKPIISIGLMMLYEKGLFKLTDPVKLYIPSFDRHKMCGIYDINNNKNIKNISMDNISTTPIKKQIRIWQLLTHCSGLTYGFDINGVLSPVDKLYNDNGCVLSNSFNDNITLKEFIDNRLTKMPLVFEPGTKWNYGLNTDVCGRLCEVLSGMKLDEYLNKFIFQPLQMNDTSFYIDNNKKHRFSALYMSSNSSQTLAPGPRTTLNTNKSKSKSKLIDISAFVQHNYDKSNKYLSGGGGLVSTLEDYKRFTFMLLNKGKGINGNQIISRKTLQFMTMNHLPNNSDLRSISVDGYNEITQHGIGFGLGFSVILDNNNNSSGMRCSDGSAQIASVGNYSWGGAADTFFWVDPKEELCVVFMTQLMYNNRLTLDLRAKIQTLVYSSIVDDGSCKCNCIKSKL